MSDPASWLPPSVREIIERLAHAPHPEGGFYRETWRSPIELAADALPEGYPGSRSAMTSILFLLPTGVASALHRVRSEELWLHHQGDDVELGIGETIEEANASGGRSILGQGTSATLQAIVPAGQPDRPRKSAKRFFVLVLLFKHNAKEAPRTSSWSGWLTCTILEVARAFC